MKELIRQFDSTIHRLADRWAGAGPLLPGFPLLAQGTPLTASQIADVAGVSVHEIEQALKKARCAFDESGHLIDLFGMMLAPTYHRLEIGGKVVFSCCALWAHVIPRLVDREVLVESVDPYNRNLVRLVIAPEKIKSVDPVGAMATMAVAETASLEQDVGTAFCRHVQHFGSPDSARKFAEEAPSRRVVSVEELNEIAAQLHSAIWEGTGRCL